jgi:signal transduction histidine kinase
MKISWGTGQVLAFLVLALVLVSISVLLELDNVANIAIEGTITEGDLIAQSLYLQIRHIIGETGTPSLTTIQEDPRIGLILQAAIENSPSVVFVAICDSLDRAIAHTTPTLVGSQVDSLPRFPEPGDRRAMIGLLKTLGGPSRFYVTDTPLLLGMTRFATIRIGIADVLLRDHLGTIFRRGITAAVFQVTLAVLLGFILVRLLSKRIRMLEVGVTALREGHFDRRIPETGLDEFSRLARDLNLMSERFQQQLKDRESSLGSVRQSVELLGEGIVTITPNLRIELINGPAGRILGIEPEDSRGKLLEEVLGENHPLGNLLGRLFDGERQSLTIDLPEQEGEGRYVAIAHRIDETGAAGGALIELKEAAALARLHTLVDHSRVLSRLGQMAAGVAHEIRNPLQAIELELAALRQTGNLDPSEIGPRVQAATEEVQRLQRAVSGFLKVARLRELKPMQVEINELLRDTHGAMEGEANLSGLELELDLEPEVLEMVCDREVLRQAIENLLRNAIQALPSRDGKVVLSSQALNGEVGISVKDTGPGIPPEHLQQVTDLYFTTKETGTGVGLSLVRQAIELHGGELKLDSALGEGTVVTLRLPLRSGRTAEVGTHA